MTAPAGPLLDQPASPVHAHFLGEAAGADGPAGLEAGTDAYFTQFPQLSVGLERVIAEGELVAVHSHCTAATRCSGRHRPTQPCARYRLPVLSLRWVRARCLACRLLGDRSATQSPADRNITCVRPWIRMRYKAMVRQSWGGTLWRATARNTSR
ncbi:nuclear transport factor 2 family protein [Streptomyces sp. NPDC049687]|uniref:nuclear transport factor 2 family protein n=1 Tax=Streptomyces sp. NPDC049687 TaxID=3365596 RepID=UPI0037A061A8